ncbi:MAG: phosphotransferase family protein [Novosphingobium sp.]|nr:phosphotransferase family protein [Novosphingobium sp.]
MAGGASKEQFVFTTDRAGSQCEMVLRMDPRDGVLETSRVREAEVLKVARDVVPVPIVHYADYDGTLLGMPGLVTSFVNGVTKPPEAGSGVSGLGTGFNAEWRAKLAPQFVTHLAAIHRINVQDPRLEHFSVPDRDPRHPALWEVNHWSRVWEEDQQAANPLIAVTENWLRANLPECTEPVLVHGDYRTGNYLFDAETGDITAILDWELAHIGDFHQDLALSMTEIFSCHRDDGVKLCSSLMTEDDFIAAYERATARKVCRQTLQFYRVLSVWSLAIMGGATGLRAAKAQHNHQDILLTWLSMVVYPLSQEILTILDPEN